MVLSLNRVWRAKSEEDVDNLSILELAFWANLKKINDVHNISTLHIKFNVGLTQGEFLYDNRLRDTNGESKHIKSCDRDFLTEKRKFRIKKQELYRGQKLCV